jgi:hypothetical protein
MSAYASPRRYHRLLLALAGTLAILAGTLLWTRPSSPGFATPDACLEALRDACKDGDAAAFRRCLGEPLRANGATLFDVLRRDAQAIQHWSQYAPEIQDRTATILVDQVRTDGMIHRIAYRLEQSRSGWHVVALGPPEILRPAVRPGTHVNETAK